jgi:hypothetical protein
MKFIATISLCLVMLSCFGQDVPPANDSTSTNDLKVYLNCGYCYQSYLKTEITWVDFVQDQFVANINLLITSLTTGSSGSAYNLIFIGRDQFDGMRDTLAYTANAIQTDVEIREGLAQTVRMGLVRYLAKAGALNKITIGNALNSDSLKIGIGENPNDDPWNAWVFNVGGNFYGGGQKTSTNMTFYGNVSANRTTAKQKFMFRFTPSYTENRFEYDGFKGNFVQRNLYGAAHYVRAINEHWSYGSFASGQQSIFSNFDFSGELQAAVEYNIYPYKEAQTKAMTFAYFLGVSYMDFSDTTIFNQTTAQLLTQNFNWTAVFNKEWGSVSGSIYGSQYVNLNKKYKLGGYVSLDVRLFKGLSVNGYISYEAIHDQINLRRLSATQEDLLLQQKELATNYSFWTSVGLGYRFGSIYNNVVNPRFSN